MIGDVNEDYVQAANDNMARPRFRWKTWVAAAACAALVLGAYPVYQAAHPPLHEYVVMKNGGTLASYEEHAAAGAIKAPASGVTDAGPEATMIGGAYVGDAPIYNEQGADIDGTHYYEPGLDAPAQEKAAAQYDHFWNNLGPSCAEGNYPEWCGGVWIDNSYQPEARLAVAIVDGFRTPELEAQIIDGCGGEVVFQDVKYSWSHLDQLMVPVGKVLDSKAPSGACFGFGVDVMENRLTVDVYGCEITNDVLAELARLDPDGDAILVRVYPDALTMIDEASKGPAPVVADERSHPVMPGGDIKSVAEISVAPDMVESSMPVYTESKQSARYGTQPGKVEDLPEAKCDVIYGAEE